jgi:hypothetical protein
MVQLTNLCRQYPAERAAKLGVKLRKKARSVHAVKGGCEILKIRQTLGAHMQSLYIFSIKDYHGARREACRHLERRRCRRLVAHPEFERPRPSPRAKPK